MDFFCELNLNKWNASKLIISKEGKKTFLTNDFLCVEITDNQNKHKYFFNPELNVLIFYRGIIFKENTDNLFDSIINGYLKDDAAFADKLYGFFSFALVDFNKRRVVLVSDKIGQLKLYYSFNDNLLLFSSVLSTFNNHKTTISEEGLAQFILINYNISDKTIFNEIKRTLPGTITFFEKDKGLYERNYFDLFNHLINISEKKLPLENVAGVLKKIADEYSEGNNEILTLTSGLDSRLLLSAVLSNKLNTNAFTFGTKDNLEFTIAELLVKEINNPGKKKINYNKIHLENDFEEFITTYFQYINNSKNIEININRFHYVYTWNKIKESLTGDKCILTGLCGDSFLRDGIFISHQTNELLLNLITSENKVDSIKNCVSKNKGILEETGLNQNYCIDYLKTLFAELIEGNKYHNHLLIKIKFSIQNYFGSEINTENSYVPTYPIFLDIRYLESLVKSGYGIISNKFLDSRYRYKMKSHKFYYKLINQLYDKLNNYPTNRGFPLKYSSSNIYLPLRVFLNIKMRSKKSINDLNYKKWRSLLNLQGKNNLTFDDSIKLKVLSTIS